MADLDTTIPDDASTSDAEAPAPEDTSSSSRRFWGEFPALIVIALVLAFVLKAFVVQAFYIPSASMEPTLGVGDRVLVTKFAYRFREPERGEVVVFREDAGIDTDGNVVGDAVRSFTASLGLSEPRDRDFIKRLIGLPGDVVEMREGVVFVNGEVLPEAAAADGGYLSERDLNDFGPITVEPDHYFMMGDNRPNSSDSRFALGQIERDQLLGRAFVIIWPFGSAGALPIADYDQ